MPRSTLKAEVRLPRHPISEGFAESLGRSAHRVIAGDLPGVKYAGESPAEANFLCAWDYRFRLYTSDLRSAPWELKQQVVIEANGRQYRLDFAHQPAEFPAVRVAVEIDGHEFHERTKEQATKRNVRDRDLVTAGWRVIHFSGSELWADPLRCATDVEDAILSAYDAYFNSQARKMRSSDE